MNIDKIYKLLIDGAKERELEKRKEREKVWAFARQRFEEVAAKALKENKIEED